MANRWTKAANQRSLSLVIFGVAILLVSLGIACNASAGGGEQQVCDVEADYVLGVEDYPRAISLHAEVVRKHSESHLNLALVYERRGLLADAEREMLSSLRLNPNQPDVRNALGVIYAEEGETVRASAVWRELLGEVADYEPARRDLELLASQSELAHGETVALALPGWYEDGVCERALFVIDSRNVIAWSYVSPVGVSPGAGGILAALEDLTLKQENRK